jgi:chitinase
MRFLPMRVRPVCLLFLLLLSLPFASAQGTVPTFRMTTQRGTYTVVGKAADTGTTTIATLLVPVTLVFNGQAGAGKPKRMDASGDTAAILASPVFANYAFPQGGNTQYGDAMERSMLAEVGSRHTLLAKPEIRPVTIHVPAGYGYVLSSKSSGQSIAIVDSDYIVKQLFLQVPKQAGRLVIAVAHNTSFYAAGDATVCCTTGAYGVDPATGSSFVLSSYLKDAPAVVKDQDVQPLTEQMAEFFLDPLHNPSLYGEDQTKAGNVVPAWIHPGGHGRACGGPGIGSSYYLLEPTDTNGTNQFPASAAFAAHAGGVTYHLQNVALLHWYAGGGSLLSKRYSFPDARALPAPAVPCRERRHHEGGHHDPNDFVPTVKAIPNHHAPNGHALIGYIGAGFQLDEISSQWDVVILAFAPPAEDGAVQFHLPDGVTEQHLQRNIAALKKRGNKVLLSLGGGGAYYRLDHVTEIPNFVSSVQSVISTYGFDGVDIDFESPSLDLQPGDTDFRHPVTPSIVNLLAGLRALHAHFGKDFMISLVPEGTQIPGGGPSYGGQFGSYLPLTYGLRDILSFVDVQDYNTPPLEGLDGEIYQVGSVDYDAAMTELLLQGFDVAGNPQEHFPGLPADKVAVGFLAGFTDAAHMQQSMRYLITGHAPAGSTYTLRQAGGYPGMIGAMLWTIDADRSGDYAISNTVGPELHGFPRR